MVEQDQVVHGPAGQAGEQAVPGAEAELGRIDVMAGARTQPAVFRDDERGWLVGDRQALGIGQGDLGVGLDQRPAVVAVFLRIRLDFGGDAGAQGFLGIEQGVQPGRFLAQLGQFLADLEAFQAGQLAQADFEDVFGLDVAQLEGGDQVGLWVVRFADDLDDLVDVEQDRLPAFEDVDALFGGAQAVAGAALDGGQPETAPLGDDRIKRSLARRPGDAEHGEVDRRVGFQAGVGEQQADQVVLALARRSRFDDQADVVFLARFVAHAGFRNGGQEGGLEIELFRREHLLAGLFLGHRVGAGFDFRHHRGGRYAGRQFGDDQAPLAAGQRFDLPFGADAQAAAASAIGGGDFLGRRDDLRAARVVGAGDHGQHVVFAGFRIADQADGGMRHFTQVMGRDFGGHADRDARGAVEQAEGQAGREQGGFVIGAVVVRLPVHRAFVEFGEQQFGDGRQAGFGVAHGGGVVAVARAEVALAVDDGVAQAPVLRHAHHGVVHRRVAVRVVFTDHVADDAGRLDVLRAAVQAHAVHGVQDAALHRLLAVGHRGQGAAGDDAHCVFEVAAGGVVGGRRNVVGRAAGGRGQGGRFTAGDGGLGRLGRRGCELVVGVACRFGTSAGWRASLSAGSTGRAKRSGWSFMVAALLA